MAAVVSASNLTLSTSASAAGVASPVALTFTLSTSSSSTLVDPDKLYVTLPKSFALNYGAISYATPVFGTAAGGGTLGPAASGSKPIGSVNVVSSYLESQLHVNHVTGKLYLVSGVTGGLHNFGLEIAVPFGPYSVDFVAPIVENATTKLSTIEFTNLDLPDSLTSTPNPEPLPWSTFQVVMPSKTSVGLAGKCGGPGAVGSVSAQLENYGQTTLLTPLTKGLTVVCPPTLKGRVLRALSAKPMIMLTARARGGAFTQMTLFLPKSVKITKALRKDIKVMGAKVKRVHKMGNKLQILFRSATHRATVKVMKVVRIDKKVVAKLRKHKKVFVRIKLRTNLAGATSAKIRL